MKRVSWVISLWLGLVLAAGCPSAWAGQKVDRGLAEQWLVKMAAAYEKVKDYTAIYHLQFMNDDQVGERQTVFLKFRKPLSIYLKWIAEPNQGREILLDQQHTDGRMLVRTSFFPYLCFKLDPHGSLAMSGRRHAVTDVGLGYIIKMVQQVVSLARSRPEDRVEFYDLGQGTLFGRSCQILEAVTPPGQKAGYIGNRVRLWIDQELCLPIKVSVWDDQERLVEDYAYQNTRLNLGLTEKDFSPDNPDHNFNVGAN